MNVLVACEESQAVCLAFRRLGHNAIVVTFRNAAVDFPSITSRGTCLM